MPSTPVIFNLWLTEIILAACKQLLSKVPVSQLSISEIFKASQPTLLYLPLSHSSQLAYTKSRWITSNNIGLVRQCILLITE